MSHTGNTREEPAILFDRSRQQGRFEMTGRDRLDLLHRMSTNDLTHFNPGEGRSTVLTTALARIIDRVIVYHRGDTALVLANQLQTVRMWLQKHIFFQDQVKQRDVSNELGQLELYGPQAASIAEGIAPGASGLALHSFIEKPTADGTILVARTFPLYSDGYTLIAPIGALEKLRSSIPAVPGDETLYERLRVEAGLPGPGHELTEDYIPLEANLWDSVSFSKGCYIGQEIIARMESRNRLAKTLVSLRLAAAAPIGASLTVEGRTVGKLTSVVPLADQTAIALGFVKPDAAIPGNVLSISDQGEHGENTAEVTAAPLIQFRN